MKQIIKFTAEEKNEIIGAEILGQQAFVNGKCAAPAMDDEIMKLIKKYSTSDFSKSYVITAILKNWIKGWHTANLVGDLQ